MKVLILHPQFSYLGGAERVIVRLANHLTDNYITNTIITTAMCDDARKELESTRILECGNMNELDATFDRIYHDFDVIFIGNEPAQLMLYGRTHPNVWLCNEPPHENRDSPIPEQEIKAVNNFIRKIVVADKFNQDRFKRLYNMDSEVVNYGIDSDFFEKGDGDKIRKRYNLEGKFVITQVANFIHPKKNQERAVEIFKNIKEKIPNAVLILTGNSTTEYGMQLRKKAIDGVIFTDWLSYVDIRDLYHASNVVIAPIKSQGGWLSIFDAISAGKPVIVSKEATCSNMIEENKLGFVENFEDTIISIAEGKSLAEMLDNAIWWVQGNLTWKNFGNEMIRIFKEAIR